MDSLILSVLQRTLIAGTPLLLATIGEIIAERSGVLNLGVEGMLAMGAVTAFIVTKTTGSPFLGTLAAVLVAGGAASLHAFVSVTLQSSQVVSGLALTMLGLGISGLWGKSYVGIPLGTKVRPFAIPVLHRIPVVGEILFQRSVFFYLAVILGILAWFVLRHTSTGIAIRSAGENPRATETQGYSVSRIRYLSVITGGAFAGLAGAHLSISYSASWIEGMTAGRGWIVIGLTIFALWRPLRAFIGAFLFGGIFVLQYVLQPIGISPNLLAMLPYLTTLVVLVLVGFKKGNRIMAAPAALGEPFRRDER
jgi:general nucleoside transport system permease protein